MFTRLDTIPACDRRTDRRMDGRTDGRLATVWSALRRYAYASRGKNRAKSCH